MPYPPRDGDLTRNEILAMAKNLISRGITVWFKFTCPTCGLRCTADTKNTMAEEYECFGCYQKHRPTHFGMLAMFEVQPSPPTHTMN